MTYLDEADKKKCFGCGNCANVCPKSCITMRPDEEGFLYPVINATECVDCNLCRRSCPKAIDFFDKAAEYKQKAFAAVHKDEKILMKSASGGAFSAILATYNQDDYVVGACYDENFRVKHSVSTIAAAAPMRKSKYVQSDLSSIFSEVKTLLDNNKKVIFTGTPCQVAGLKSYLGKEYAQLLTVDLICHGVPSYKAFSKYLDGVRKKYKDEIVSVEFRHKEDKSGIWNSKLLKIVFRSGNTRVLDYNTSAYMRAYDNGLMFRPSCSKCPFATSKRVSDLTIGDLWGAERFSSVLNVHKGTSLIISNSSKGSKLINEISKYMDLWDYDYQNAIDCNARLRKPDSGHLKRCDFFSNLDRLPFEKNVNTIIKPIPLYKQKLSTIKNKVIRMMR